jgi:hypothetical protein
MHELVVVKPYVEKHLQVFRKRIQDETLIMKEHKLHFTSLLKDLNIPISETPEENIIYLLATGLSQQSMQ